MDKVSGFLAPFFIAALVYILNALLPGRWITGYITRPGSAEKMKYHINGIYVLIMLSFFPRGRSTMAGDALSSTESSGRHIRKKYPGGSFRLSIEIRDHHDLF